MNVKDLRTLVDNLDEYIHVPGGIDRLKKTVLHLAVSGQLVQQDPAEGTGEELYKKIKTEKAILVAQGKLKKQNLLSRITDEEIPFQIPKTWQWAHLGDITNYGTSEKIKPAGISDDTWVLELEDIEKVSSKLLARITASERGPLSDKNVFYKNDIIYGKLRPYLDKVLIADDGGVCSSELMPLRVPGEFMNVSYLWLSLKSPYFIDTVNELTYGVKMPRLGTDDGRKMPIPLPPHLEQKRIVEKVDTIFQFIDELAEEYRAEQAERGKLVASSLARLAKNDRSSDSNLALQQLAEIIRTKSDAALLRETILHLAVSGQLVEQRSSEGTGEELHKQIQTEKANLLAEDKLKKQKPLPQITEEEIPFQIPKTWQWVRAGCVSNIISGTSYSKNDISDSGVRILRGGNIIDGGSVRLGDDDVFISSELEDDTKKIRLDDVVIVASTGSITAIGKPSIVDREIDAQIGAFLRILRADRVIDKGYFWVYIRGGLYRNRIKELVQGTNINNIKNEYVTHGTFPLPPLAEQTRIVQKTTELLNLVAQLERYLEK